VLDQNTNVTRVEIGPQTFTKQEHEKVLIPENPANRDAPYLQEMVKIPPRHYVVIKNPVIRDEHKQVVFDSFGDAKLKLNDEEVRFEDTLNEPFPLYPGEVLSDKVRALPFVQPNTAIRLRALRDFQDGEIKREAGDEWIFEGPATYYPRVEVQIADNICASIIKENEALKIRARKATVDKYKQARKPGEEWLVRENGAYLPGVDEGIIETVKAYVLTEKRAIHLRATMTFTDVYGIKRASGEEWLITINDASTHIPDVYEDVVNGNVTITTLTNRQYCVVCDPVGKDGKNQFGTYELRVGDCSFFLKPGEKLQSGIQNVYVLSEEEALLLNAKREFTDNSLDKPVTRKSGERWMIKGPRDYVPPVEVEVVERRKTIPLDDNEGIYVRDTRTGKVRSVHAESYMLQPHEVLWEKELSSTVEELLNKVGRENPSKNQAKRDKTRVVTYRAPHNSAVQVYDYKKKECRIILGPELIMLAPDEEFTVLSISGGTPKKEGQIKSLALLLGPDFMTDVVTVETSDHARLALQLAYNWNFQVDRTNSNSVENRKFFQVPDFVGDACKAIASRVRGAVASATFDHFHKNSSEIIKTAVFGIDKETTQLRSSLPFPANNLVISNIDVQSVEPVDQKTRDSLQKSVQLAIEITTSSQEANARHEAQRIEQEAKGRLEAQRIKDEAEAEQTRIGLLDLQAKSATVEASGQATAEAQARAEAAQIEGEAAVEQAKLRAQASAIQVSSEIEQTKAKQEAELKHLLALNELEVRKKKEMALIETRKFKEIVNSIGADTISSIAQAGPELQAKLLQGLGLKSFLITDGNSPINLFNTAQGLLGGLGSGGPVQAL